MRAPLLPEPSRMIVTLRCSCEPRFMKILAYAGSAFAIVMSLDYLAAEKQQTFEYPILIVLSTVGMGMLISAGDLIALYLGLELMSLALYVVAASNRAGQK